MVIGADFLAGRHPGWFVVGASIGVSNIGSEHLLGPAGSGAMDAATFLSISDNCGCEA